MTSKLVVNTIEADTGISSVSFGSSISLSSTSKFFFSAAGIDIGADTNINRPASGVLGFNINSSEKARIDSSGRVLIGTTTEGSSASDDLTIATSGTTGITIRSGTSSNGNIEFSDGTSGQDEYRGVVQYAHSDNSMRFYTDAEEKVRIDSSGRLGIGTDQFYDGTTKLEVRGRINTVGSASTGSINAGNGTVVNMGSLTPHDLQVITGNSTRMTIKSGTGEALRIDSVGRVMIGTTTEGNGNADEFTISYINHAGVSGGDQGRCGMTIRSGDNTSGVTQNGYIYFSDGTSGANESMGVVAYEHSTDSMYFSTVQVPRLRIDQNGLLGLNVTPSYSGIFGGSQKGMHIGGTTAPFLRITSSTGSQGDLLLQAGNSGGDVQIGNMNAAGDIVFYTKPSGGSNTERFRITSEGDLKAASFDNTYACMYRALSNSSSSNMMNSAGVMVFSSATYSMGNSNVYNTSNGRYTAPIRGLYLFNVNVLMDNSANGNTMGIRAYVNGSATDIWYIYERSTTDHYKHTSGSHVIALNAGQYHQFYATAAGAHISNETCFSACLIQAY